MAGIKAVLKPNIRSDSTWLNTEINIEDLPALQAAILISGMVREYHGSNTAIGYIDIYRR